MIIIRSYFILITIVLFIGCELEESKNNVDYNPEQKLEELGILFSIPSSPVANYVNTVRTGNLIYISGKGPLKSDGSYVLGKLGENLTLEQGYEAARLTALNLILTLKASIGDLSEVKRIVRVTGMVNATSDFTDHPKVMNGCSDLLVEVFGENGKHTRVAVGMNSLPLNIAVEIDMIVEISN